MKLAIIAALLLGAYSPGCGPKPDPVPPTPTPTHVTDAGPTPPPAPSSSCAADCAALNAKLAALPGGSKPVDCAKQCGQ